MKMGVSVVVCTYNGKNRLTYTLNSIIKQEFSFPFELLLIDNASTDNTFIFSRDFLTRNFNSGNWRVFQEFNQGLSNARRRGIMESKYPIILFCDDDNWLSPDYLEIGMNLLQFNHRIGAIGGFGKAVFDGKKPVWFDQYSHSYAVGSLGRNSGPQKQGSWVYGAGCFFRKDALQKLLDIGWTSLLSDRKGNSLSSGGDVELCYAIQMIGYEIWFEPDLSFSHWIESKRLTWNYYLRLKESIAESFPLLHVYQVLLSETPELKHYQQIVRNELVISLFVVFKQGFLNVFKPLPERKLAIRINLAKIKGFANNRNKAVKSFKWIKKSGFDYLI